MIFEETSRYKDKFVVGVDFGEATVGLALGKEGLVTPVQSVSSRDRMFAVQQIIRLVRQNKAQLVVIGLPLSIQGSETQESAEVRKFAKILGTRLGTSIEFVNEYGSTYEAEQAAIDGGLPQKSRKKVDSISAAVILKRFFSEA